MTAVHGWIGYFEFHPAQTGLTKIKGAKIIVRSLIRPSADTISGFFVSEPHVGRGAEIN